MRVEVRRQLPQHSCVLLQDVLHILRACRQVPSELVLGCWLLHGVQLCCSPHLPAPARRLAGPLR